MGLKLPPDQFYVDNLLTVSFKICYLAMNFPTTLEKPLPIAICHECKW